MLTKFKRGFTLIELIVVIAIIAILAGLLIVRIGSANADARNARRKADLAQVKSAIEQWKAKDGGQVNTAVVAAANLTTAAAEGAGHAFPAAAANGNWPKTYLQGGAYPVDPLSATTYYTIAVTDTSQNYTLAAPSAESGQTINLQS